jgi:hypothetical protein
LQATLPEDTVNGDRVGLPVVTFWRQSESTHRYNKIQ